MRKPKNKRIAMKRVGKIGKLNKKANEKLKKLFSLLDIRFCELRLDNCLISSYLQFCHRHKRIWYRDKPEKALYDLNQVILGCTNCHNTIEYDKEKTESMFTKLRGDDVY